MVEQSHAQHLGRLMNSSTAIWGKHCSKQFKSLALQNDRFPNTQAKITEMCISPNIRMRMFPVCCLCNWEICISTTATFLAKLAFLFAETETYFLILQAFIYIFCLVLSSDIQVFKRVEKRSI